MIDLTPFTNVIVWYFVVIFVIVFPLILATGEVFISLLPAVAVTTWLSLAGYIPLWYMFLILLIVSFVFTFIYIVPIITKKGGDGYNG